MLPPQLPHPPLLPPLLLPLPLLCPAAGKASEHCFGTRSAGGVCVCVVCVCVCSVLSV